MKFQTFQMHAFCSEAEVAETRSHKSKGLFDIFLSATIVTSILIRDIQSLVSTTILQKQRNFERERVEIQNQDFPRKYFKWLFPIIEKKNARSYPISLLVTTLNM